MEIATSIADAFEWWISELRGSLGIRLPSKTMTPSLLVSVTNRSFDLRAIPSSGENAEISLRQGASEVEILAGISQVVGKRRPLVEISLDRNLILTRSLSKQNLPSRRARAMAEIDLLADTPFDSSHVYCIFDEREGGQCYHIVKRTSLDPLLAAVQELRGSLLSLSIDLMQKNIIADRASMNYIIRQNLFEMLKDKSKYILSIFAILLVIIALYQFYAKQRQAISALDVKISSLQEQAKEARDLIAQRDEQLSQRRSIRAQRDASVEVVRIWAELTKTLPDDAFVTDLSIAGTELTLAGFSNAAAGLIALLDASPLFKVPEFVGPVLKIPGQKGERFVIRLVIDE